MKRKRSVILAVLLLVLSLPVSVGAAPASNGVTLETDSSVSFLVYMDENGNTYSWTEYKKKRADSIREQVSFDFTKWYGLYFDVENGQITEIDFGDLRAIRQGH